MLNAIKTATGLSITGVIGYRRMYKLRTMLYIKYAVMTQTSPYRHYYVTQKWELFSIKPFTIPFVMIHDDGEYEILYGVVYLGR